MTFTKYYKIRLSSDNLVDPDVDGMIILNYILKMDSRMCTIIIWFRIGCSGTLL